MFSHVRGCGVRKTSNNRTFCTSFRTSAQGPPVKAKEGTTLSSVADQSSLYGENLPDFLAALLPGTKRIPFAYESIGAATFFRDVRDPHPRSRRVFAFHQPATLATWLAETDTLRARLAALPTTHPLPETNLRACQIEAIAKLEASFAADRPRALIQMATGAGKTYTACAFNYQKRMRWLLDDEGRLLVVVGTKGGGLVGIIPVAVGGSTLTIFDRAKKG